MRLAGLLFLATAPWRGAPSEPYFRSQPRTPEPGGTDDADDADTLHLQLKLLHVIFQHGDRTPVTPLKDASFWQSTLPAPEQLAEVEAGTQILWAEQKEFSPALPPDVVQAQRIAQRAAAVARGKTTEAEKAEGLRKAAAKARNRAEDKQEAARLTAFKAMEQALAAKESGTADEAASLEVERLRTHEARNAAEIAAHAARVEADRAMLHAADMRVAAEAARAEAEAARLAAEQMRVVAEAAQPSASGCAQPHPSLGDGVFGSLTAKGLDQMERLGTQLRDALVDGDVAKAPLLQALPLRWEVLADGASRKVSSTFYSATDGPFLEPEFEEDAVSVFSTNFPRTVTSARALLSGLYPPGTRNGQNIRIDARKSEQLIPDPTPRESEEQLQLEAKLLRSEALLMIETKLSNQQSRLSFQLAPLIHEDAYRLANLHGPTDKGDPDGELLGWNKISDVLRCLRSHGRQLPYGLSDMDVDLASMAAARRVRVLTEEPRLAQLGIGSMVSMLRDSWDAKLEANLGARQEASFNLATASSEGQKGGGADPVGGAGGDAKKRRGGSERLALYAVHDSTLFALMGAFKLCVPVRWPDFGAALLIELLQDSSSAEYYLRFSLDGQVLRSAIGLRGKLGVDPREAEKGRELVPLADARRETKQIFWER